MQRIDYQMIFAQLVNLPSKTRRPDDASKNRFIDSNRVGAVIKGIRKHDASIANLPDYQFLMAVLAVDLPDRLPSDEPQGLLVPWKQHTSIPELIIQTYYR
ncbi:hypothetical protein MMC24_002617 [Lignoscripta atroalba]|nr:hypothetical protein [Lignoscripta atroalba]